jgi:glycyl-tRNA synthetase
MPCSSGVSSSLHLSRSTAVSQLPPVELHIDKAYSIGVAGLYDYGPTGSGLQANVIDAWRKHYIIEEDMLELDTTIMTLGEVLKTSGHVDK